MGEKIKELQEATIRLASKRLIISLLAMGVLTWLYLRLDTQFNRIAFSDEFQDQLRLIQEKGFLFDKFQWSVVAIVIAFVTGDVVGKFKRD